MTRSIRLIAHPWAVKEVQDYLKECDKQGYKTRWTQGLSTLEREFVLAGAAFELEAIAEGLSEQTEMGEV